MAAVGRLCARGTRLDELGVAAENEQRRQPRRQNVDLADVIATEVEGVELAPIGQRCQPDSKAQLWRSVFGHSFRPFGTFMIATSKLPAFLAGLCLIVVGRMPARPFAAQRPGDPGSVIR